MTFKKWLRKIALFPLSVMMGIPDEGFSPDALAEIASTDTGDGPTLGERIMSFAGDPNAQFHVVPKPDAAASQDIAADADQQGNQGEADDSDGLDTTSDEDGQDADSGEDDDEGTDDSSQKETDEVTKGTKKKTFDERMQEIENKLTKELEAKLAARDKAMAEEKPDWTEINQEKVDTYVAEKEAEIDALRLEGKYTEARKISRELDKLEADLEANEQRRIAWVERQNAKKTQTDDGTAIRKELDQAAELYREELKIDLPTWNKMGEWFESKVTTSKLLSEEFNDVFRRQGKVAAIRFAHEYTVKHMGQETKKANEKKEQSKTKAAAVTSTTTGKVAPIDIKKATAEFEANPTDEAFMKLQALKRQARAA